MYFEENVFGDLSLTSQLKLEVFFWTIQNYGLSVNSPRETAINLLYKIENAEGYSNIEIDKEFSKSDLSDLDKGLASELVYGVLTWKITLDEIIKRYSSIKIKKISDWILNILRIGIYQIVFLDRIPVSAAVNESVKLAKKYGHEASSRFTNAILRKIEKNEFEKLMDYLATKDLTESEIISIATSHPLWLVNKLLNQFDKKFVTELLSANNEKTQITIRANTLKTSRDDLLKLLKLKGYECTEGNLQDSIFVNKLNDFTDSLYVAQDEAAQMSVLKLAPKPGEKILDACSAPGGKTTYIAALMNNQGLVDAWDIHEHRVKLVEQNAKKLGINIIKVEVKDATEFSSGLLEYYDRILLDVPCTGIGVIRKKPDIKWSRHEEDIADLSNIQAQILSNCSKYLKKGGKLVYSTCTIFDEENSIQIQNFLKAHSDFKLIEEIKLYPNINKTDGFYIAVLERNWGKFLGTFREECDILW